MPRASDPVELRAAGVLRYCTGETVEPYDRCPRCGDFHEVRAAPDGRFDLMCGDDRAVEVTQVTSSVAERNRRSWEPYLKKRAVPELNLGWHVVFESTAKATYGGRKGNPRFRDALTVISPALAGLERRGVHRFTPGTACIEHPFHEEACPYGILGSAGVTSGYSVPSDTTTGYISAGLLTGSDQMPAFNPDHWARKAEKNRRQGKPPPPSPLPEPLRMGPVLWSFGQITGRRFVDARKSLYEPLCPLQGARGTIVPATGSGKTITAAAYALGSFPNGRTLITMPPTGSVARTSWA